MGPKFKGEILEELAAQGRGHHSADRPRRDQEGRAGHVETLHQSDLTGEEAMEFGAIAGALIGLGAAGEEGAEAGAVAGAEALADRQVFDDDQVVRGRRDPEQHGRRRRADRASPIPLRDAIIRANGIPLIDEWIHPTDLVAAGLKMAEAETQPA